MVAEAVTQQKKAADCKREDLEKRLQERMQDLGGAQAQAQRLKVRFVMQDISAIPIVNSDRSACLCMCVSVDLTTDDGLHA